MGETQRGNAKKFGIVSTVAVVSTGSTPTTATSGGQTGSGLGKANIVGYSVEYDCETIISKSGSDGIPVSRIDHGHIQKCTIDLEFYDDTISNANAAFVIPSKGMTFIVTDASDAQIAGNWIVDSSSKKASVDGIGTGTISGWRDVAALLSPTTAVVS